MKKASLSDEIDGQRTLLNLFGKSLHVVIRFLENFHATCAASRRCDVSRRPFLLQNDDAIYIREKGSFMKTLMLFSELPICNARNKRFGEIALRVA